MILGVNNGDNDDGNSVVDPDYDTRNGDVDGHDDDNDNDGGDFDDSACQ